MSIYLLAAGIFSLSIFLILFTVLLIKLSKRRPAGAIKFILPIFLVLTILCGAGSFVTRCKHQWTDATCSDPKICALCGKTEGTPLEHQWQEATCNAPRTCMLCEKTEGEPLEHTWIEATCTAPKTCSVCGATEGEPLEHVPGEWIADELNPVTGAIFLNQYCEVCGQVINQDLKSPKYLYENGAFVFSADNFSERLGLVFQNIKDCDFSTSLVVTDDDTMGCVITDAGKEIGMILFNDDNGILNGDSRDSTNTISSIMCFFLTDDMSKIVTGTVGIIVACDVQLELDEATDVARNTVLSVSSNSEPYYKNGIGYAWGYNNDKLMFVASVLDK